MKRIDLEDSEHAELVEILDTYIEEHSKGDSWPIPPRCDDKVRNAKRFRPMLAPWLCLIVSAMLMAGSVYHGHRTTKAFEEWQVKVDKWNKSVAEFNAAVHK